MGVGSPLSPGSSHFSSFPLTQEGPPSQSLVLTLCRHCQSVLAWRQAQSFMHQHRTARGKGKSHTAGVGLSLAYVPGCATQDKLVACETLLSHLPNSHESIRLVNRELRCGGAWPRRALRKALCPHCHGHFLSCLPRCSDPQDLRSTALQLPMVCVLGRP